jgi:hypothetical protein
MGSLVKTKRKADPNEHHKCGGYFAVAFMKFVG